MEFFKEIAPHLANPLVLIGFALMLVFGMFRAVVSSGIIPTLRQEDAPLVVRLLLTYGFWVAVLMIVIGFAYSFGNNYLNAAYLTGNLKIVEATVADDQEKKYPVLDVSFRNDGKAVAALVMARIAIKNVWLAKSPFSPAARYVTAEYKAMLPITGAGCVVEVPIQQDVSSNGTDRFQIVMANDSGPTYDSFIYDITVEFVFNESQETVKTGDLIFMSYASQENLAANVNYERRVAASVHNQYVVRAVKAVAEAKLGPEAKKWIEEEGSTVEFIVDGLTSKELTREERLNGLGYLSDMGFSARPAVDRLRKLAAEGSDIADEINTAAAKILAAAEVVPPITKTRLRNEHSGCSPAPMSVRMETSAPF